jgi:hypothetical protein
MECLEEYDDYSFKLVNITEYEVMEGFPRLRRSEIDKGISGAVYEINLDEIYNFKVG